MAVENTTPNRGYQLPHPTNDLADDVARLIAALTGIDVDIAGMLVSIASKADAEHDHVIANITGLAAALAARQELSAKGAANGYAGLGADGKVPAAQLPSALFGALSYQGAWNANTNSPTIPAATAGNKGYYYKVSVAGATTVSDINDWQVGDWIVSNGAGWDKIDNTDQVLSVAGLQGAISAVALAAALGLPDALAGKLPLDGSAVFIKADPYAPAFTKTGAFAVSIKAGTIVEVGGALYTFSIATAVTMPVSPVVGDYAIWIKPNGDLVASDSFSSPPVANSRLIGGFHYAPGGNATAFNAGGNSTPQINPFSIWDLKFRPACPDPRGMALVAGSFWCDIYLLGVDHHINGTSRYNVTIADGSSPPKIPTLFGGSGSTAYGSLNWWEAAEVMQSHGKDLLSYAEFAAAAYGVKEAQSGGTDPVSTIMRADYTSIWGLMLASGNLWVWGRDFGGNFGAASWAANTGGRGSTHTLSNVAIFGGDWDDGASPGSRASGWNVLPSVSSNNIGARGRSDHLILV